MIHQQKIKKTELYQYSKLNDFYTYHSAQYRYENRLFIATNSCRDKRSAVISVGHDCHVE